MSIKTRHTCISVFIELEFELIFIEVTDRIKHLVTLADIIINWVEMHIVTFDMYFIRGTHQPNKFPIIVCDEYWILYTMCRLVIISERGPRG